jgi:hypothetical protein
MFCDPLAVGIMVIPLTLTFTSGTFVEFRKGMINVPLLAVTARTVSLQLLPFLLCQDIFSSSNLSLSFSREERNEFEKYDFYIFRGSAILELCMGMVILTRQCLCLFQQRGLRKEFVRT